MDVWAVENRIVNNMVVKVEVDKKRVVENQIEREVMNKSPEFYMSVVQNMRIVQYQMIVPNQSTVQNQSIRLQSRSQYCSEQYIP
jgi:hypothetical protein